MDKFKFDEKERDELYDLMGVLNHSKKIATLDRIETIISSRADGWVKVEDVPTDKNIMKQADIFTEDEEGPYSRYSAFIAGAKWMKEKLIPSPPKTKEQ